MTRGLTKSLEGEYENELKIAKYGNEEMEVKKSKYGNGRPFSTTVPITPKS